MDAVVRFDTFDRVDGRFRGSVEDVVPFDDLGELAVELDQRVQDMSDEMHEVVWHLMEVR